MIEFLNTTLFNIVFFQFKAVEIEFLNFLKFFSEWEVPSYFDHKTFIIFVNFFSFDEFQLKLLKGFFFILICNIFLIFFTWKIYGKRICNRFMKTGKFCKLVIDF